MRLQHERLKVRLIVNDQDLVRRFDYHDFTPTFPVSWPVRIPARMRQAEFNRVHAVSASA